MANRIEINYTAEVTARKFHKSPAFFRGIMGPIGSGKSVTCTNEIFKNACEQEPWEGVRRVRWAAVRNTYPELKSTTIKTWQDWFPDEICPIKWDAPITGRMALPLADGTSIDLEILFLALDKPKDVKKLLSLELTGIWFNEAREIPKSVVDAGTGRVGRYPAKRYGGCTRKTIIADTNPPDDDHWWYKLSEEETPDGWDFFTQPPALIKRGNIYVPNPVAENIRNLHGGHNYYLDQISGKDPEWIKVYILGQYGTVQDGKPVYPEYRDDIHCASNPIKPHPKMPLMLGWDFGLTPACVVGQMTPMGRFRVLQEFTTETRGGLRQFVRNVVKPSLKRLYPSHGVELSVGDPAGKAGSDADDLSCMQVLREEGFPTLPAKSNSPLKRLGSVKTMLSTLIEGQPAFQISPDCKTLRKGFNGGYKYVRVQVSGDEKYRDVPDKNRFSHPHDALQYLVMTVTDSEGLKEMMELVNREDYMPASSAGY